MTPVTLKPKIHWDVTVCRGGGFGGGEEGQPPLLAISRRGKTIYLPLHLTHSAGWLGYNWVFLNGELTDFTGFV